MYKLIIACIFIALILFSASNFASPSKRNYQDNRPPVVKIINPKNNASFAFNTPVNYEITVSDKEDGDSKFDEINAKEVLLEVRYINDTAAIRSMLNKPLENDAPGLRIMRTSNCFNCHNFTGKLIGPSLFDISKKYPAIATNNALLATRIKEGASGVWGKVTMPKHPELTGEQTRQIAEWILKNAANPQVTYYTGTEGTFKINVPAATNQKGEYMLTASYIDHGLKDDSTSQRLKGRDVIMIYGR